MGSRRIFFYAQVLYAIEPAPRVAAAAAAAVVEDVIHVQPRTKILSSFAYLFSKRSASRPRLHVVHDLECWSCFAQYVLDFFHNSTISSLFFMSTRYASTSFETGVTDMLDRGPARYDAVLQEVFCLVS